MANANSENPYVGRKFQELVQSILEKEYSTSFEQEAVVAIGKPPKGHKFDSEAQRAGVYDPACNKGRLDCSGHAG